MPTNLEVLKVMNEIDVFLLLYDKSRVEGEIGGELKLSTIHFYLHFEEIKYFGNYTIFDENKIPRPNKKIFFLISIPHIR